MKHITYILLFFCISTSCSSNHQDTKLEKALILAGNNRSTFENVLKHYKNDSLKYKAARFLIENMPYHYSLEEYFLSHKGEKYRPNICNFKNSVELQKHCDSLISVGYHIEQNILYDVETISKEFLLNNIELAFKVWEKPWATNISFENFCKYILPYRAQNEQISNLRGKMMDFFLPILDSAKVTTPLEACKVLNEHLRSVVKYKETGYPFYPTIEEVYQSGISRCDGICNLGIFIMRAVGIPVTVDFTIWSKMDLGHSWCVVLDNERFHSFGPGEEQPGIHANMLSKIRHRRPAKVYRLLYNSQRKESKNRYKTFLDSPFLHDVTHEYLDATISFHVPILNTKEKINENIFLCVYNNNEWKPLALGKYTKNGTCHFENIVGDNIFIVANAVNDKVIRYITAPFYVNKSGEVNLLIPNADKKLYFKLAKKIYGEHYILQYWDVYKRSFTPIPYIKSTDTIQIYNEIPDNALLWFITPKKLINKRIFFITNDTIRYY